MEKKFICENLVNVLDFLKKQREDLIKQKDSWYVTVSARLIEYYKGKIEGITISISYIESIMRD